MAASSAWRFGTSGLTGRAFFFETSVADFFVDAFEVRDFTGAELFFDGDFEADFFARDFPGTFFFVGDFFAVAFFGAGFFAAVFFALI
ncbi:MAG: hypothetical protein H7099_16535 [Gemmatimonadaceae bacterium]|nr:hypothetical protein [Gemmatimonadaceae bacterium]